MECPASIRVLVVDDHRAVRLGLVAYLEAQQGIEVVGEAEDGRAGVELCRLLEPDLVLMDIHMPVLGGVEATRAIKRRRPWLRVLLLSGSTSDGVADACRESGADGFLPKGEAGPRLVAEVRRTNARAA